MRRLRLPVHLSDEGTGAPERLPACPSFTMFPLRRAAGGPAPVPVVRPGEAVTASQCLATSPQAALHASCAGVVERVDAQAIHLRCDPGAAWVPEPAPALSRLAQEDFGRFLAEAGIVGMGGSQFPAAVKFASAPRVETVVVNGAECEPGTTIDTQLLLHAPDLLGVGADALARATGASQCVLALGHTPQAARIAALYPWRSVRMPPGYPAGAERLVLERVMGQRPPAGILPGDLGALVQNVATVRAIGRALRDGIPCVERPLTLLDFITGRRRNLIVPVGMPVGQVAVACGWTIPPDAVLVAGGLMMGMAVPPETPVTRGTTSLAILPGGGTSEEPCVRCGACYDACPLGLHPIELAERCQSEPKPYRDATRTQLAECFLCGVCSAVCPARIPIAARLREARYG